MIEVNEYVRTKDGKIGIFDRYSSRKENSLYKSSFNCFIKIRNRKTPLQCCEDYIVKHSKKPVGVIKCGDFVNGMEILHIEDNKLYVEWSNEFEEFTGFLENKDIRTILTKESYMANCYKVGGEDGI